MNKKLPTQFYNDLKNAYIFKDGNYFHLDGVDLSMNKLKFHPLGGGFGLSIKMDDEFIKNYLDGSFTFTDQIPDTLIKGKFGFECWGDDYIEGFYYEHERWNGWAVPYLTLAGVEAFNKLQEKYFDEEKRPAFVIKGIQVYFYDDQEDQTYEIKPLTKGLDYLLYDCGLGLTWDLIR